jgi:alanyl-tRNA synthetase
MLSQAPEDPEIRAFEADVARVDGRDVILDRTYFYAESGGQPADRGTIEGVPVTDVREVDGRVRHELAEEPPFRAGESVAVVVDDDFRTYCTRAHTASHLLYGAGRRLLDDLGYGGFDIGPEKVRVDLSTTSEVDDDALVELERLVNRAVWESRPVSWEEVPVEEATAREEVAFNAKTEEGVMADADSVRLVTVGGADGSVSGGDGSAAGGDGSAIDTSGFSADVSDPWDVAACGGTHVSNTREIGHVEVLERSNPGEGLTRVEFAVGPPGIDRRATVHRAALGAARELGVGVADVGDAAADLRERVAALEGDLADAKGEVLDGRLAAFDRVERDGVAWRVGSVEGFDPNEVGERAQALVDDDCEAIAAVGEEDSPYVVIASDGAVDAGDVVESLTDEYGGGGGGGPDFAQGGGLSARPGEVVERLRGGIDAAE